MVCYRRTQSMVSRRWGMDERIGEEDKQDAGAMGDACRTAGLKSAGWRWRSSEQSA